MESGTDKELPDSYVADGDEPAFAELVSRYHPMVYRTCWRLLGNDHDAEDAAQAAFLVLARKAGSLRQEGRLNGWLHRVARLTALEAVRKRAARERHQAEYALGTDIPVADHSEADMEAVLRQVDTALDGLSVILREAVVLRYLRGFNEQEAAAQVGCPLGTMKRRASDGIAKLRARLTRRGVTLSGAALAGLLASEASAAVPETLLPSILASVKGLAAATAAGTGATSSAIALAKGAMKAMFIAKVKTVTLTAAACLVVAGTGVVVAQRATPAPPAAPAQVGVPPSGGAVTTSPSTPPKGGTPTAPATVAADYKPGKLTAGVIVGVTDGKRLFRVKLDQPFNDLAEISVSCCSPPAVILLDGQPATFEAAVVAGRRVEFEHVRGPTPYLSVRSAAEAPLRFTEADNGKTVTVKLGQTFEVVLLNGREGAGWEPAATEITGASVERVNKLRRGNCDEFMAEKAPTPDTTLGMYKYRYNAVKIGTSIIRLYHLIPSGPVPKARDVTGSLGEFKLTVDVLAEGAPDEETARRLAAEWVKAQGYDWGEIVQVRDVQGRPAIEDLWVVTFSKPVSRKVFGGVDEGTMRPIVHVYKKTGKVEMLSMN